MARPSEQLNNYLSGLKPDPDAAVYSWASFMIYKKAASILRLPKERRLKEIEKAPEYLQQRLKDEVVKLYGAKKK